MGFVGGQRQGLRLARGGAGGERERRPGGGELALGGGEDDLDVALVGAVEGFRQPGWEVAQVGGAEREALGCGAGGLRQLLAQGSGVGLERVPAAVACQLGEILTARAGWGEVGGRCELDEIVGVIGARPAGELGVDHAVLGDGERVGGGRGARLL